MFTTFLGGSNPIARVGTDTNYVSSGSASSYTVSVVVDTAAKFLVVPYGWGRNADPGTPTATYNGVSMTLSANTSDNVGGILAGAGVFTLANPATGTHNFVITFSGAVDSFSCRAVSLSGVDLTTPVQTTMTANGGGSQTNTLTGNLVTTTRTFILGAMVESRVSGTPSYTPGTGVTELFDGNATGGATSSHFAGERQESTAGTYAFAATSTTTQTAALAAVAIASL